MDMGLVKGLAATAVAGGVLSAGITAVATRDSESGDGARAAAKGLGIAAGVTGALGIMGLTMAFGGKPTPGAGGFIADLLIGVAVGGAAMVGTGVGAGLGGAAIGAMLVGNTRD